VTRRAGSVPILIGLIVAMICAQNAVADNPTLYVRYTVNCTFTITGDNGAAISTIPPGTYQVVVTSPVPFAEPDLSGVSDPNLDCGGALSFRISGPGVDLHTTLEDGDSAAEQYQATFSVGSYVAVEDRRPTVTRVAITVSTAAPSTGGGSSASSTGGSGGSSSGGGSSGSSTTKSNVNADPIGSALTPLRGTLNGGVSTIGNLTLMFKGKAVSSLKAGRYKITVLDETARSGFTIQRLGRQAVKLTGTTFLGRHSVTLALNAGQWFYYSPSGKKTYFIVVS
jgi:hypothetical protein